MIVIIQCASRKRAEAGYLQSKSGRPVKIVAHPEVIRDLDGASISARPDDISDVPGRTWRQQVVSYNASPKGGAALGLLPAYDLYDHPVYAQLVESFGIRNVYILSAGWGLVRGDYLLPCYDMTFSPRALASKRRLRGDRFQDFRHVEHMGEGPLVFVGGKDYLPLFEGLVNTVEAEKIVAFRSEPADLRRFGQRDCGHTCHSAPIGGPTGIAASLKRSVIANGPYCVELGCIDRANVRIKWMRGNRPSESMFLFLARRR